MTAVNPSISFPLERPPLRRRRRDENVATPISPMFYAGPENSLACFVGQQNVDMLLETARPLLIVGDSGTGKTAIAMHAGRRMSLAEVWNHDGHASTAKAIADRVMYMPATDYARQFASAIDSKDMPAWRQKLDQVPVLIIDDIHAIVDKAPAQIELAMRLDSRDLEGLVTIVTCRRLPTEIRGLRPPLVSRTLPGLTVTLVPPTGEARRQLLRELMIGQLPETQPEHIAMLDGGLDDNVPARAIAAAVKQITLWCRMNQASIDESAIQAAIDQVGTRRDISIRSITTAVAKQLGVKSADLRSGSRRQNIVRARSLAMWLSRQLTQQSLAHIGDAFGRRDHSTVLHAIRKTDAALEQDATLRRAADQISHQLTA